MKRVVIFTAACTSGWAFAYDADDQVQAMIKRHADKYNNLESWKYRHCDGSVTIHDTVEEAIKAHDDVIEEEVHDLDGLLSWYKENEDGCGRHVDAAWIVHLLLVDSRLSDWMPPL